MDRVGKAREKKALAAMLVLGFKSPSFSVRTDIILPVDVNRELRNFLLSDPTTVKDRVSKNGDAQAINALGNVPGVYVPEVSKGVHSGFRRKMCDCRKKRWFDVICVDFS